MTKSTLAKVVVAFGLAVMCSLAGTAVAAENSDYLVRITSTVPGQEVAFSAALMFRADGAPFTLVTQKTPYELRARGTAANMIIKSADGSTLTLEVVVEEAGRQRTRSKGTGSAVVYGSNIGPDELTFITPYR